MIGNFGNVCKLKNKMKWESVLVMSVINNNSMIAKSYLSNFL